MEDYVIDVTHELTFVLLIVFLPWLWSRVLPREVGTEVVPVLGAERHRGFDFVRGIAIVGVVLIHILIFIPPAWGGGTAVVDMLNNALRFVIPVFLIASGALLRPPSYTVRGIIHFYIQKYVPLVVPYVIVTIGLLFINGTLSGPELIKALLTGGATPPLYFMVVLFQLYFLYPWIEYLCRYRGGFLLALVISLSALAYPPWGWWDEIPLASTYFASFALGIYLRPYLFSPRSTAYWGTWSMLIVVYFGLFAVTGIGYLYNSRYVYGALVFLLLFFAFRHGYIPAPIARIGAWLGVHSLWIFMLHYPLVEWLVPVLYRMSVFPSLITHVLVGLVAVTCSVACGIIAEIIWQRFVSAPQRVTLQKFMRYP